MKQKNIQKFYTNVKPVLCWEIKSKKQSYKYTDYNQDLYIKGNLFQAGKTICNQSFSKALLDNIDNYEFKTYFDDKEITIEMIATGDFDNSEIIVYMVNPEFPDDSLIIIQKGYIKEILISGSEIKFEVTGMISKLSCSNITKNYSATCRTSFGSSLCKVNKEKFQTKCKVKRFVSKNAIEVDHYIKKDFYSSAGKVFDSKRDCYYEIRKIDKQVILLDPDKQVDIEPGDEIILIPACSKEFKMCRDIYDNAINFRGEPHLPGVDELLKTSSTFK